MKAIAFLTLLAVSLGLYSSCARAQQGTLSKNDLVGRWILSEFKLDGTRRPAAGVLGGYMDLAEDGSYVAEFGDVSPARASQQSDNRFFGKWALSGDLLITEMKQSSEITKSKVYREGLLLVVAPEGTSRPMVCYYLRAK
jgi:hypothetical protein